MNVRKIKMALTAGLINKNSAANPLAAIKELMNNLADDAGHFLGLNTTGNSPLGNNATRETFVLRYENCTLDVELVSNPHSNYPTIRRFDLR